MLRMIATGPSWPLPSKQRYAGIEGSAESVDCQRGELGGTLCPRETHPDRASKGTLPVHAGFRDEWAVTGCDSAVEESREGYDPQKESSSLIRTTHWVLSFCLYAL